MELHELQLEVVRQARDHCAALGYVEGPNWNPLEPQDPVAALAMARSLIGSGRFDHYLAVAPEGHAYGFFFERLGARVLSVFVDYPPRVVTQAEGLAAVAGGRVLLIEDDVASGMSLRLVLAALESHPPASVSLYLGRLGMASARRMSRKRWPKSTWRKPTSTRPTAHATRRSLSGSLARGQSNSGRERFLGHLICLTS